MSTPANPFVPDRPVSDEFFVGRKKELDTLSKLASASVASGCPRVGLITGPRGIGKTNLLRTIQSANTPRRIGCEIAPSAVAIQLDAQAGNKLVGGISASVYDAAGRFLWRYRFANFLNWAVATFKPSFGGSSLEIKNQVPSLLETRPLFQRTSRDLSRTKPARLLVIAIDEVDRLQRCVPDFAQLFRDFVQELEARTHDQIGRSGRPCPVLFLLLGLPIARSLLTESHSSFPRLATHIQLSCLSQSDVSSLVDIATRHVNASLPRPITYDTDFTHRLYRVTGGHPYLIQELGSHCFQKMMQESGRKQGGKANKLKLNSTHIDDTHALWAPRFADNAFIPWIDDLDSREKDALVALAIEDQQEIDQIKADSQQILLHLRACGYVNAECKIVSSEFRRWLKLTRGTDGEA